MRTINCLLVLDKDHSHPVTGITPAEAIILKHLHNPDVPTSPEDPDNPYVPYPCLNEPTAGEDVERTDRQEVARLKYKYNVFSKKTPNKHVVEDLFPGANPALPKTFKEIGLQVAAPDGGEEKPAKGK